MTIEEIKYASKDYVNYLLDKQEYHNENYTEDDIKQAFEKGAMFANNNPKSPWTSIKEKLPYNDSNFIHFGFTNTKVYVAGKSKEIQKKLFSLGYTWKEGSTDVMFTDCPFLYIDKNHIQYGTDMHVFSEHKYREITAKEILSLELIEPTYRPFKNAKECFEEMKKHYPIGWMYCDNIWDNILVHVTETGVGYVEFDSYIYSFIEAFNKGFTFADGQPFGIKE